MKKEKHSIVDNVRSPILVPCSHHRGNQQFSSISTATQDQSPVLTTSAGKALPTIWPILKWKNNAAVAQKEIHDVPESLLKYLAPHILQSIPPQEHPAYFMAWVPVYTNQGSATCILYLNGEKEIQKQKVRTLLKHTCGHLGKDPHLLRKGLGLGSSAPLSLGATALVAMRMRNPVCPRDNTLGYVNLCYVRGINPHPENHKQTLLYFCNGEALPVLWNFNTIRKRLERALSVIDFTFLR